MDFLQSPKLKIVNDKLKILKINSFNRTKLSEFSQIKFIKNEFWKNTTILTMTSFPAK
jgi:hypothetical protein